MNIRKYKEGDQEELYQVFYSSVHNNTHDFYNKLQLDAWAPKDVDLEMWKKRLNGINPFVVVNDKIILGYADLQENGYIDHFFVRGLYDKKGIGQFLINHIFEEARKSQIKELSSNVSLSAEKFFLKNGFTIIERKTVIIRGIELRNAKMKKRMD